MVLMYLYYNQPEAISNLERLGYDKTPIKVIIIDDGSKEPLACEWATVYRINEDVPWNMPKANNLGFSKIPDEIVMRMDIDHFFTIDDLQKIYKIKLKPKEIIKFPRIYKGKKISEGKNIYLAQVNDIVKVGGYNEIFCGNYGYEDGDLMDRLKRDGFTFTISDIFCYVDGDLHTKDLNRNTDINYKKYLKIIEKSNL